MIIVHRCQTPVGGHILYEARTQRVRAAACFAPLLYQICVLYGIPKTAKMPQLSPSPAHPRETSHCPDTVVSGGCCAIPYGGGSRIAPPPRRGLPGTSIPTHLTADRLRCNLSRLSVLPVHARLRSHAGVSAPCRKRNQRKGRRYVLDARGERENIIDTVLAWLSEGSEFELAMEQSASSTQMRRELERSWLCGGRTTFRP
jgi:hypothetical protein